MFIARETNECHRRLSVDILDPFCDRAKTEVCAFANDVEGTTQRHSRARQLFGPAVCRKDLNDPLTAGAVKEMENTKVPLKLGKFAGREGRFTPAQLRNSTSQ